MIRRRAPNPNDNASFRPTKEYCNMTVPQTLKTWTAMETILAPSA
ncbi:hypothetical protein [Azospirillum soli]